MDNFYAPRPRWVSDRHKKNYESCGTVSIQIIQGYIAIWSGSKYIEMTKKQLDDLRYLLSNFKLTEDK